MLCLRCTRRVALAPSSSLLPKPTSSLLQSSLRAANGPFRPAAAAPVVSQAQRSFASFSNIRSTFQLSKRPTLPTTSASNLSLATVLESPGLAATSQLPASVSAPGALLQSRGPKRDTFDPSHRVRKRRHGFLARLRTRNGRNLLRRRRLKKRTTLSH